MPARFAIVDEQTGEVVHIHVDASGVETPPEEAIQIADPEGSRKLSVHPLPEDLADQPLRFEGEELRHVDDETVAHGGAEAMSPFAEPPIERRYERQPRPRR